MLMNWFDDFAERVSRLVARAPFFVFCVLLVVIWLPTLFAIDVNTSQLIINTVTTILTFLLVALLQNTQDRSTRALNRKLDVLAVGLAMLIDNLPGDDPEHCADQLREIAGTEMLAQD